MPQLGRFDYTVQTALGLAVSGASVAVYREGATVNGNQSGATPLTVTVRHRGKITSADTVFINTATGTTYTATVLSATSIQLSGFSGTLSLTGGDRITPSNSTPTLYGDDQAGASTSNPLTSTSTGRAQCWLVNGAFDVVVSGGGATTTAFTSQTVSGESPTVIVSGETDSASAVAHAEDTYFSMATAGAKLKSFRNLGTEKASVDKDGTGIFPRIGQSSTATTGGAIRFVDGNVFPLTVAGVQAALDECESAGGGTVYVPSQANIAITTTPIKIPNHVALIGTGTQAMGTPTFIGSAATNTTAIVQNKTQDGTQQIAQIRNVHIDGGGEAIGSTITSAGLWFKRVLSGSYIKDCRVVNVQGIGMLLEGTTASVQGPFYVNNITVANCSSDCIKVLEGARAMFFDFVEADNCGNASACIRLVATAGSSAQSISSRLTNVYMETGDAATQLGIVVDSCANVCIDGVTHSVPSGVEPTTLIQIKGTANFAGGTSGCNIRNVYAVMENPNVLVDDQTAGVQVKVIGSAPQPFRFLQWYSSPLAIGTNGIQSQGQIVGMQYQKQGATITAAATITPLEGNYFVVSGNTGIGSITATSQDIGRIITLNFSGTPTVTDGSNLKMAGNLVATADDTLTMICDGTNWIEIARSVN